MNALLLILGAGLFLLVLWKPFWYVILCAGGSVVWILLCFLYQILREKKS